MRRRRPSRLAGPDVGNGRAVTEPTPSGQEPDAVKRENGELELGGGTRSPRQRAQARRLERHTTQTETPIDPASVRPTPDTDPPEEGGS